MCEKNKCKNPCGNCKANKSNDGEDEVLAHKHLDEKNMEDYIKWYNSMVNLSHIQKP